eukprot:7376105-Prymnesium_polylepis.1
MLKAVARNSGMGMLSRSWCAGSMAKYHHSPCEKPPSPAGSASPRHASAHATMSSDGGCSIARRSMAAMASAPPDRRSSASQRLSCLRISSSQRTIA